MEYKTGVQELRDIFCASILNTSLPAKRDGRELVHFLREPDCTVSHFSDRAAAVFN